MGQPTSRTKAQAASSARLFAHPVAKKRRSLCLALGLLWVLFRRNDWGRNPRGVVDLTFSGGEPPHRKRRLSVRHVSTRADVLT